MREREREGASCHATNALYGMYRYRSQEPFSLSFFSFVLTFPLRVGVCVCVSPPRLVLVLVLVLVGCCSVRLCVVVTPFDASHPTFVHHTYRKARAVWHGSGIREK